MDNQDHRRIHIPGHECHGVHLCHKCGWPFPNPHPSAKHRRAHKRICGTIEGYKLLDSEGHTHSNASDDSDDDHKTPSPKTSSEMSKNEKVGGGIGEKINRSEDEVFSDAIADFSDGGLSSDSAISVERFDKKDSKSSELSENKGFDGLSQLIVKLSENFQMQSPEALQSEEVEVGKTLELQGQPSSFIVNPPSFSNSDLRTEASTIEHSDDFVGFPSNSHHSKVEAMSDVIPETVEHVTDCSLTSVAETNLKEMDGIESDRDMVEIVVSSTNVVGEITDRSSKIEVSDEVTSSGEMADGAATPEGKNNVDLSSAAHQDNVLPFDADSVVDTNAPTNVVQLESKHVSTSTDPVKASQEKGEGGIDVFTLSNPDLAHSQSEFEDCKNPEGEGVVVQNPSSLQSSEALKHEKDDLKETVSVTEEYHSNFDSNQEEKEVLSPALHVLDDSIKQGCINCEPIVQVTAEEQAEVSPVEHTVDGDQRSIEYGASEDSMESEINKTRNIDSSEEAGSDDVGKNLQHRNLLEGNVMVLADDSEDFKDCEEAVSQNPLNNLPSSEAFKVKEDDLRDTITEKNHSNFKLSQLSEESEVISPDMHVLDDSIMHEQVDYESKVEDTLAEEQAVVYPVLLIAESNQRSDEIGASMNVVNTEKNESHVDKLAEEQAVVYPGTVTAESNQRSDEIGSSMNAVNTEKNESHIDKLAEEQAVVYPVTVTAESNQRSDEIGASMNAVNTEKNESHVDKLAEEQAVVHPVTVTAESNLSSDEIGAPMNDVDTEKNESHVAYLSVEHKFDEVCRTLQEESFPEDCVMASSNENPRDVSIDSSPSQTSVINRGKISHCEEKRNDLDDVAVDSKCKAGDKESNVGIKLETLQPSDPLQLESKTSSDVFKSDDASERGQTEKCDEHDTQGMGGPLVKDTLPPNSGSIQFESQIVSEDVMDGYARKPTAIDSTYIDAVSGIKEEIKGDEIINNSKVQEECNLVVGTYSNLPQARDTEPSKAVENDARELPPYSHLDTDQSAQSIPAVENNTAVEPSGEAYITSIVTAPDQTANNLVKFGSGIDASVYSSSRCDSMDGNWGSVSVLSVQSDAPAMIDGEALAFTEAGKSNLNSSKAAPEGPRSEKSDMFEPPSFMTLVESGHMVGPKAAVSEDLKGRNPQQPNPNTSQAGWFPTLTQVVNESQGRKKNEEIIAKVTNWSTSKQHTPLKSLLGEAANSNKPRSPKLEENQASPKNGKVGTDNGSGLTTVNSILGPESPAAPAVREEAGKEWNSPARYPADIKREKRKVKSRPYWVQFVCCTSVDRQ